MLTIEFAPSIVHAVAHFTDEAEESRPLWGRIAGEIEQWAAGEAPGAPLPSEAAQTARLGVSRVTLRRALKHLQHKGLIESQPGRGWYVAGPAGTGRSGDSEARGAVIWEPPGKLMGFTEMARLRGLVPDSIVLEQRVSQANFEESEALRIAPGAPVLHLVRVRRMNERPVAVDRSVVPLDILPDAEGRDFARGSLHDAFRVAGFAPMHAEVEIEAAVAGNDNAQFLDVPQGFPVLTVRQVFLAVNGRLIERGYVTYRADRYRYRARLRA